MPRCIVSIPVPENWHLKTEYVKGSRNDLGEIIRKAVQSGKDEKSNVGTIRKHHVIINYPVCQDYSTCLIYLYCNLKVWHYLEA